MKGVLVASSVLFGMLSCKHDPMLSEQLAENGGLLTESDVCDEDSVYFSNEVLPLFQSSCGIAGCHDPLVSEEGFDFTSYSSILASGEVEPFDPGEGDIMEAITESDKDKIMPPPPNDPLTPEQIQTIQMWILQGALNNSCLSCDFPNVSFSGTVFPLIEAKCEGCHSGADPSGNLLLTNYSQVKANADNGSLIGVVDWLNGYIPMPNNGNKLPQCEIDMIQQWIDDGAPNN